MKKITTFLLSTVFPSKTPASEAPYRVVRITLFLIIFSSFSSYAIAGIQEKQDIPKMVQRADLIIRGKVISTESQWKEDSRGRHIYTSVTVKILDKIKGNIKDDTFAFEIVGGTVGDIREIVSGTPAFEIDEDAIVFLAGHPLTIKQGINSKIPIYDNRIYWDDSEVTVNSFIQAIKILEQDPNASVSLEEKDQEPTAGVTAAECFIYSGYKWFGTSPTVYYYINQNTSDCAGEGTAVQAAASSWNNVGANFTLQYGGSCSSTGASQNLINCITWGTVYSGAVAETTTWYYPSTGEIIECDIVFNDPDYTWSTKSTPYSWEMDVESVGLHEFGHWLFLDDLYDGDDSSNVMYGYISLGDVKRTLQACDIAGICYIYGGCTQPDLYDDGESYRSFSPTTIQGGQNLSISTDIRNGGTAASGSFVVKFYASLNTTINTSDYYIGQKSMSSISAGSWANCDWSGSFPSSIPAGVYWVGWIIDADNNVSESNEDNNTAYKQGYQLTVIRSSCVSYEDFETGDFSSFPWGHSGNSNWFITSAEKYSGTYSARGGAISHNQSTNLEVTLDCTDGDIEFYRKVSSESGYDYLKFYIDGILKGSWSGTLAWSQMSYPVSEGNTTFKWTYSKDGSISSGSDTAWIDDIIFPVECNEDCNTITIGTETSEWEYPMHTYYHDSRTQVIYLASEIGMSGTITALGLDVATVPGQIMNDWTIRMKHTTMSSYGTASLDATGWTVVYQGNEPIGSTGWRTFNFSTPFEYNGSNNLLVDFSHDNASYSSNGTCRYSTPGGTRSAYAQSDSVYGNPLDWSGTASPTVSGSTNVPNVKLTICEAATIKITPPSLDFGSVQVGSYADLTFTVQNVGGGTLTGSASVPSPFSIVSGGSYSLTADQSQVVTVRFSPPAAQSYSQTVTFTGGGGATRPVSGTGILQTYTITASAGANGTVEPNGVFDVNLGDDVIFIAEPNAGYTVDQWYLDGNSVQQGNMSYTLYNVQADHNVLVTFIEILPMDLNNDGILNFGDFVIFAFYWMDDTCSDPDWCEGSDPDYSGRVDFVDLLNFVDYWLWCRADLDLDGDVDFVDYAVFASHWMNQNCAEPNWCSGADLNKSGSVDLYDLGKFADNWLEGI